MLPTLLTLLAATAPPAAGDYFVITVTDEQTGRGVPLIELRTVHGVAYHTDSNGVVAFHEPGLMNRDVFFHVAGHGYEHPKDGFGYRGKALRTAPGGSAKLTVKRGNIAERLYRITGGGIYRDSLLAGRTVSLREPALNAQVLGSDSVLTAPYRNKLYWFWGDTLRPSYPLGNFNVTGAASDPAGGPDPEAGVDLTYFTGPDGFAREMARMPGKGLTWLTAVAPLPDETGRERLYAHYVKVEPPLKVYARGMAVFDDDKQEFVHAADAPLTAGAGAIAHTFRHTTGGVEHVYFASPFPLTRVRATAADFLNPAAYESFTPGNDGPAWRKNAPPAGPKDVRRRLRDGNTGKPFTPHNGSVYWNAYRRRWVMIAVEIGGTSHLGEVWYAEADAPVGPWRYAVKVVTHDKYSFYNPKHHPEFDGDGGRVIYFEGTYTHTFSGNPHPTPRYDYNQVMYRLDLADPRAVLPVAVYETPAGFRTGPPADAELPKPAFFAPDRPAPGAVPVLADGTGLRVGKPGDAGAVFHAVPDDAKGAPAGTVPLYEYRARQGGGRVYSTKPELPGYDRAERPVCRVWPAE